MPLHSPSSRSATIVSFLGSLLILLLAALQAFGFFNSAEIVLESTLRQHLPPSLLSETPRVVLISLEKPPQGYASMDVAMVLRGLVNYSPRCIVVNGLVEPEQGPVPFLPTIFAKLKTAGISFIEPQIPSLSAHFQSVSLIRYSLTSSPLRWSSVSGKASPGAGDALLPERSQIPDSESALPLFAKASDEVPIGSLWWWALPRDLHQRPPLLLGSIFLQSNNTAIHLTPKGAVNLSPAPILEISLDDFLLHCEQREQGTISPAFDSIWNKSSVILGSDDDRTSAALFAALLGQISTVRLPMGIQLIIAAGWIIILLIAPKIHWSPAWLLPLLTLSVVIVITFSFLLKGVLFPFLPGIATALLLFSNLNKG